MNDLITWLSENLRDFGICVAEIRRNSKTKKLVFFASEVSTLKQHEIFTCTNLLCHKYLYNKNSLIYWWKKVTLTT